MSVYEILNLPTNYPTLCIKSLILSYEGPYKDILIAEYEKLRENRKAYDQSYGIVNDDIVTNDTFDDRSIFAIATYTHSLNKAGIKNIEKKELLSAKVDECIRKIKLPNEELVGVQSKDVSVISSDQNDDGYGDLLEIYSKAIPKSNRNIEKTNSRLPSDTIDALEIYTESDVNDFEETKTDQKPRNFVLDKNSGNKPKSTKSFGKKTLKNVLIGALIVAVSIGAFEVVSTIIKTNYVDKNDKKISVVENRKQFNYKLEFGDYSVENIEERLDARPGSLTLISGELKQAGDTVVLEGPTVIANGYEESQKKYIVEIDRYTVKEGDTLNNIAQWYINNDARVKAAGITNKKEFAREIGENNENIPNINKIIDGQEIVIRFKVSSDTLEKFDNEGFDYEVYEAKGMSY